MSDDERIEREVLAASVEWGLNPPQPGSGIAEDAYLAPQAAETVLQAMVAEYKWLSEWVDLAKNAALAAVTVEVAQAANAPRLHPRQGVAVDVYRRALRRGSGGCAALSGQSRTITRLVFSICGCGAYER